MFFLLRGEGTNYLTLRRLCVMALSGDLQPSTPELIVWEWTTSRLGPFFVCLYVLARLAPQFALSQSFGRYCRANVESTLRR